MIPFGEHPVDAELHAALLDTADELIRRTGAGLCDWNRSIEVHGMKDSTGKATGLGIARWNGTISLREDVLTTLRDLWQGSPSQSRTWQMQAVLTVPHELEHYLVPKGERYEDGRPHYERFPGRALEEGMTELAARLHVGAFAAAEARCPGVTATGNARSYPQFVPAAKAIVEYASELCGESKQAALNTLVGETVPGKFRRLSRMVLEGRGLWEHIPPNAREAACNRITNTLWGVYEENAHWAALRPEDRTTRAPEARSRIMGLQLVAAIEGARLQAVDQYDPGRLTKPWQIAAAEYEHRLARVAVRFARTSKEPDVRTAGEAWMERADRRMQNASQEAERERPRPGSDPPAPSASRGPQPDQALQDPGPPAWGTQGTSHEAEPDRVLRDPERERPQVRPEPPDPPEPQPAPPAIPSRAELPRLPRPRRTSRLGVRRRPGPPDRDRDR